MNLPSSTTSAEIETELQYASKHPFGQKVPAVTLQHEYPDGLAALQQYSSSIDESASSPPSQIACAIISPTSTTPTSKQFEKPLSFLLGETCQEEKTGGSNGSAPDGEKQIPKPYCPPHKRRPSHLANSHEHEETQRLGGARGKLGETQKVGYHGPLRYYPSAVSPPCGNYSLDAAPEERKVRATDKAPFLEKLLTNSSVSPSAGNLYTHSLL